MQCTALSLYPIIPRVGDNCMGCLHLPRLREETGKGKVIERICEQGAPNGPRLSQEFSKGPVVFLS